MNYHKAGGALAVVMLVATTLAGMWAISAQANPNNHRPDTNAARRGGGIATLFRQVVQDVVLVPGVPQFFLRENFGDRDTAYFHIEVVSEGGAGSLDFAIQWGPEPVAQEGVVTLCSFKAAPPLDVGHYMFAVGQPEAAGIIPPMVPPGLKEVCSNKIPDHAVVVLERTGEGNMVVNVNVVFLEE